MKSETKVSILAVFFSGSFAHDISFKFTDISRCFSANVEKGDSTLKPMFPPAGFLFNLFELARLNKGY